MKTATLKFELPEDKHDLELALCAIEMRIILSEIYELLRKKQKYEDQETISIDELRDFMNDLIQEYNIPENQ